LIRAASLLFYFPGIEAAIRETDDTE
jgi:hypothetical protein